MMNSALGDDAMTYIDSFMTPKEKDESDRRVAAMEKGIEAQKGKEKISGAK